MKSIYLCYLLSIILPLCFIAEAEAGNASFKPVAGTCAVNDGSIFSHAIQIPDVEIEAPDNNHSGYETQERSWGDNGTYAVSCECTGAGSSVWDATKSDLPIGYTEGEKTFYSINDNLQAAGSMWVASGVKQYLEIPFVTSTKDPSPAVCYPKTYTWSDGGKGKITFRISKPFIGTSIFNHVKLFSLYAVRDVAKLLDGQPIAETYITGKVVVPQNCQIDAGTTITMDFGNIGAPLFSQAGAGNKPDGVNPKTHNIAIKCQNIDAQAILSMRLETDVVSGHAMVSDNKDVGFVVADANKNALTPNDTESKIKFQLGEDSAATIPITAWPVSITGKKPAEGKFTSEGYLSINFD
ncbi:fimbrial protein [Enterobacter hormaechei]